MKNNKHIGFGLQTEPKDKRDFPLGKIVDLPKLEDLPESFSFQPLTVKNQYDTDFCSAFATCSVSELQEGTVLDPLFSFAASKKLSGGLNNFGQTVSYSLKAHTKIGAIGQADAPFDLETTNKDKVRDINNYPDLYLKAIEHKKKCYMEITGPYDIFDNIRATLWKFREEKRAAVMGLIWHWNSHEYVLKGTSGSGEGHMIAIMGYTPEGLLLLNSAGRNTGVEGFHILPREEVNHYVKMYNGAFMFIDLSPEAVAKMIEEGVKLDQIRKGIWAAFREFLIIASKYVQYLTKTTGEVIGEIFSKKQKDD